MVRAHWIPRHANWSTIHIKRHLGVWVVLERRPRCTKLLDSKKRKVCRLGGRQQLGRIGRRTGLSCIPEGVQGGGQGGPQGNPSRISAAPSVTFWR